MPRVVRTLRSIVPILPACLALASASARAQGQPPLPPLLDIEAKQLALHSVDLLRGAKVVIVPTVVLHVSTDGTVHNAVSGSKIVVATGRFIVLGLERAKLQELAGVVYDDFVERLRVRGITVLTYADVKDSAAVIGVKRLAADKHFALPRRSVDGIRFAVVTPSDAQMLTAEKQAAATAFGALAKSMHATVIVPELYLTAPSLTSQKKYAVASTSVQLNFASAMNLTSAAAYFVTADGARGSVILEDGLADVNGPVGSLASVSEDHNQQVVPLTLDMTSLALASGAMRTGEYFVSLSADPATFPLAVRRGAASFLDAVAGLARPK